jgi:tripartite ATP-independent transporter DctM subunit
MDIAITGSMRFLLPLIFLFSFFLLKVPIAFSLLGTSILYFFVAGMDMGVIVEKMISQLYFTYVVIAVPLFIFTANLLNSSKISDHMFDFSKACVGDKPGALAYVNVIISMIFSGMTGSAFSDAAGIGKIECDAMERDGYDREFSAAITAATATIGPVFPPSLNMVTFAMLSGASVGGLLLGGMIPGILMAVVLYIYVGFISRKRNYPRGTKYTFKEFLHYSWRALPALLTPAILIGGIYSGFVTPTEAGALASLYAIVISMLLYRTVTFKSLWICLRDTAVQCGPILMLICCSAPLSYIITVSGLGDVIAQGFLTITNNQYVFLGLLLIMFFILGMFVDGACVTFVILPMILPVVNKFGINLVHFGVIYVINSMVGMLTPPYGMLCFIAAGVAKAKLKGVFREAFPMALCLIVILLLITYVPQIVLFIPTMVGGK